MFTSAQPALATSPMGKPEIIERPAPTSAPVGGNAAFSVTATRASTFQWYKSRSGSSTANGTVVGHSSAGGEHTATLVLVNVQAETAGYYFASAGNSEGVTVSAPAQLMVTGAGSSDTRNDP